MAPNRRVSSTSLLNECSSEPMRFSYKTYGSDMVTLKGDEIKAFFANVIQPAQHDDSDKVWNLKNFVKYNTRKRTDETISEWYLSNNEIEVYFQETPNKLVEDLSPNRRAFYKVEKYGVTTAGIFIRRRFQDKVVRETTKNTRTLLELGVTQSYHTSEYNLTWLINGVNYKKIMNKYEHLEAIDEYLKIDELSDNLKWFQCGLTWLKKWFHLMPPTVDTTKRIRQSPYALVKFESNTYHYPEYQPDTYHVINGIYRYAHPRPLTVTKDPTYKELGSFGVNMRKLVAMSVDKVPALVA